MKESVELCDIKAIDKFGKPYLKFAKLIELHKTLFNSEPNNLHNSLIDILITLRCYMKLKHNIDTFVECKKFRDYLEELNIL